ncbi:hypothetical protein H6771_01805 [Candidatus Peribacteria bacterium]|nr:hypothetical protein [Candidatus Peribacteria bacterium]
MLQRLLYSVVVACGVFFAGFTVSAQTPPPINATHLPLYGAKNTEITPTGDAKIVVSNWDPILTHNILARQMSWFNTEDLLTEDALLSKNLIGIVNMMIGVVGILYLMIIAAQMVFTLDPDSNTDYREHFLYVILGLMLVSLAEVLVFRVLDPSTRDILRSDASFNFRTIVNDLVTYLQYVVVGFIVVSGIITGYTMLMGTDTDTGQEKLTGFIRSVVIGGGVILFAEIIVVALGMPDVTGSNAGAVAQSTWTRLVTQIVGVTNFLLTFITLAGVGVTILSAVYYLTAGADETRKQMALRVIRNAIIAVVLSLSAYALVNFLFI